VFLAQLALLTSPAFPSSHLHAYDTMMLQGAIARLLNECHLLAVSMDTGSATAEVSVALKQELSRCARMHRAAEVVQHTENLA
jgi:hypothetical protein